MAPKRKAPGPSAVVATGPLDPISPNKKVKTVSEDEEDSPQSTESLEAIICRKDVEIKRLQKQVKELETALERERAKTDTPQAAASIPVSLSLEKIAERSRKLGDTIAKGIKKQMKWQPSCKQGSTKWSYESLVPSPAIFYALFPTLPSEGKAWKQKKMPVREFEDAVGSIHASCRYNDLSITGSDINVKWDKDEGSFKLSGTYGV